jgi:hypothetical protein
MEPVNPSTLRVRRYRERRWEGIRCLTVEMYEADIADATARGLLKPQGDASDVLDAWYASHLSDAALRWLVDNKVIKPNSGVTQARSFIASALGWSRRAVRSKTGVTRYTCLPTIRAEAPWRTHIDAALPTPSGKVSIGIVMIFDAEANPRRACMHRT